MKELFITFIVGLPGSGKTRWIQYILNHRHPEESMILIDDIRSISELRDAVREGYEIIYVTDPYLCLLENYQKSWEMTQEFRDLGYTVQYIFFENDCEQAILNSLNRTDKKVSPHFIRSLSKLYNPEYGEFRKHEMFDYRLRVWRKGEYDF